MKNSIQSLLVLLILVFIVSNCKDEPEDNSVGSLNFQTSLYLSDGSTYSIGDTLRMNTGYDFNLKKFKLYLSDITLISGNTETKIQDVFLADVGDPSTGSFSQQIPAGDYSQLRLGFGLNAEQNDRRPEDFDREHPQSSFNQMYWSMLKYRFAIMEGRSDATGQLNGDTSDILNAYHPGTDSLYRIVSYPLNLQVEEGDTENIDLQIFVDQIFSAGEGIDMRTEAQSHSEKGSPAFPGDYHIAKKFMDNLAETARIQVQ